MTKINDDNINSSIDNGSCPRDSSATAATTTTTTPPAKSIHSSFSPLVVSLTHLPNLRYSSVPEIIHWFTPAYETDRALAMKLLFYIRDVRGGLGERRVARVLFNYLAKTHPEDMRANLHLIPKYGRWDDLYVFVNTPLEADAFSVMRKQYFKDLASECYCSFLENGGIAASSAEGGNKKKSKPRFDGCSEDGTVFHSSSVSLLGKWLKSENTSNPESRFLARKTREAFGLSSKVYRQNLSLLRRFLQVTERLMSDNDWKHINYDTVPCGAFRRYFHSFGVHDGDRIGAFTGVCTILDSRIIHDSPSYPQTIIRNYLNRGHVYDSSRPPVPPQEEAWKKLPKYFFGDKKMIVMPDVSYSMFQHTARPDDNDYISPAPRLVGSSITVSVGLALYASQYLTGPFANTYIRFTSSPYLVNIDPSSSVRSRIAKMVAHPHYSNDIDFKQAYDVILETAQAHNIPPSDMPSALVVVTDLKFDYLSDRLVFLNSMPTYYANAGYEIPQLIIWNTKGDARVLKNNRAPYPSYVKFVCGSAPSVFLKVCKTCGKTTSESALATLKDNRYSPVKTGLTKTIKTTKTK